MLGRNVAASLGYGKTKNYKHRNMGLVVDLGPRYAVANPLNIHLSGFPAKIVTRSYHLYAIPRPVNRWAVSLAYLTDALFDRSVVSMARAPRDASSRGPSSESPTTCASARKAKVSASATLISSSCILIGMM